MRRNRQFPSLSSPATLLGDTFTALTRWRAAADELAAEGQRGAAKAFALALLAGFTSAVLFYSIGPWTDAPIWSPLFTAIACVFALGAVLMVRTGIIALTNPAAPRSLDPLSLVEAVEKRRWPVQGCLQCRLIWEKNDSVCPHCESARDRFEVKSPDDLSALRGALR